jgi:hypothetical protein
MTRKDYVMIADILKGQQKAHNDLETIEEIAYNFADVLEEDNPRFDRHRFLVACGVN